MRVYRISRRSYYADFVLVPGTIIAVSAMAFGATVILFLSGIAAWTLTEYILHRFLFHGAMRQQHGMHHRDQAAYIGAQGGFFLAIVVPLYVAMAWGIGVAVATATTAGYLIGYLAYLLIHDAMHHSDIYPGNWLYAQMQRHVGHHKNARSNFGVSTDFWDRVFFTRT